MLAFDVCVSWHAAVMETYDTETPEERRKRWNREYMRRLRATPEGRERDKEYKARWFAKPETQERIKAYNQDHYQANREEKLASLQRWRQNNPAKRLLSQTKSSARSRNLAHELRLEDMERIIEPMVCSVSGLPLSTEWPDGGPNPWAPSIDRIDNSAGYVQGNVRLTAWAFNQARGAWDEGVLLTLARALVRAFGPENS